MYVYLDIYLYNVCIAGVCIFLCTYVSIFLSHSLIQTHSKHSHTPTDADRVVSLTSIPNVTNRDHVELEGNLDAPLITF